MKRLRRQFLHLAGAAAALPAVSRMGWAQGYPARPVRFVVSFPAGGPNQHPRAADGAMAVRAAGLACPWLITGWAPPAISATEEVVRAPADGYTLLLVGPANAIGPSL